MNTQAIFHDPPGMQATQAQAADPPALANLVTPGRAKLLLAQARTILDQSDKTETWQEGRQYLQAAVREGSSEACQTLAFCHLTGENGFRIDPGAALDYMNSWRRAALRMLRNTADKLQRDLVESISVKFAALWRRCSTPIIADSALALLGRTVIGYRHYRRSQGAPGAEEILVLELDDGSEVEIINYFGSIDAVGGRKVGGQRQVDRSMPSHWSSHLSVALGDADDSGSATALYYNHEFELFRKWSQAHEIV